MKAAKIPSFCLPMPLITYCPDTTELHASITCTDEGISDSDSGSCSGACLAAYESESLDRSTPLLSIRFRVPTPSPRGGYAAAVAKH